jgi:uncharacterized protein
VVPIPASPTQWVTDTAGFLTAPTVGQLNARLRAYQHATGHQVLVYIAPTTGTTPLEDWTVRAFHAWKIGRKGLDDGLALFIFPSDRKLRIEVGYGLESTIPDAVAARIIRDTITPDIRAGHPDQAVTDGVGQILGTIGGEAPRPAESAGTSATPEQSSSDTISLGALAGIFAIFVGFMAMIFLIFHLAARNARNHISGSNSGSGSRSFWNSSGGSSDSSSSSSDDDDFSGGGGDSGGGGASGSW